MVDCEHPRKDVHIIDNGKYVVTIIICEVCGLVLSEERSLKSESS